MSGKSAILLLLIITSAVGLLISLYRLSKDDAADKERNK
jgi:hypothetical protein